MIENSKSSEDKKKVYAYINRHHKNSYERFTVFVPKKEKAVRLFLNTKRRNKQLKDWVCEKAMDDIEKELK